MGWLCKPSSRLWTDQADAEGSALLGSQITALHLDSTDSSIRMLSSHTAVSSLTAVNLGMKHAMPNSGCGALVPWSIGRLSSLPRLAHLRTAIQYPCDEYLYHIGKVVGLQSLHLSWEVHEGWPCSEGVSSLCSLINPEELCLMGCDGMVFDHADCFSMTSIAPRFRHLKNIALSQLTASGAYCRFLVDLTELTTSEEERDTHSASRFPSLETLFLGGIDFSPHPDKGLNALIVTWLNGAGTASADSWLCSWLIDKITRSYLRVSPRLQLVAGHTTSQ